MSQEPLPPQSSLPIVPPESKQASADDGKESLHADIDRAFSEKYARDLISAASHGDVETLKSLLENMKGKNDEGASRLAAMNNALLQAAEKGHLEAVRVLLTNGAEVDAQSTSYSASEADYLRVLDADYRSLDHIAVARRLFLERTAKVHSKPSHHSTALHLAARRGHVEVVKLLLAQGADVNAQDISGRTPVMLAALGGVHKDLVFLLIRDYGAVFNIEDLAGWGISSCVGGFGTTLRHNPILRKLLDYLQRNRSPFQREHLVNLEGSYTFKTILQEKMSFLELSLSRGLIQMIVGYLTPITPEEYKSVAKPIISARMQAADRFHQSVKDFTSGIWPAGTPEERVLAKSLERVFYQRGGSSPGYLVAKALTRDFLIGHAEKLSRDGRLFKILNDFVEGGTIPEEKKEAEKSKEVEQSSFSLGYIAGRLWLSKPGAVKPEENKKEDASSVQQSAASPPAAAPSTLPHEESIAAQDEGEAEQQRLQ